jgi:hypothetical protein
VKLPDADPINPQYRTKFLAVAEPILKELEQFKSTQTRSVAFNSQ